MSGSKRFIVLEIIDHVDVIKECIEFLSLTSPMTQLKAITEKEASTIVYYLAADAVDASLAHKVPNPGNIESIVGILFGIPKVKVNKAFLDAYEMIRGHSLWRGVEVNIATQIKQYIPMDCWTDWTVIKSAGLVGLTEGEDHRITEFNKEVKAHSEQLEEVEESVITINCANPINYLYNQFIKRYGSEIAIVGEHMSDPLTKIDPYYRTMFSNFMANPTELISALFCEGITRVNPQVELASHCPKVSVALIKILGIYDLEMFHRDVVSKLVIAFGMGHISYAVKPDESYSLEYYGLTNIVSIFKKSFSTLTEKYEDELVHALNRGDYLPYEERVLAERLFSERANMVLSLKQ